MRETGLLGKGWAVHYNPENDYLIIDPFEKENLMETGFKLTHT